MGMTDPRDALRAWFLGPRAENADLLERLTRAVLHARKTAHDLAQPLTTILARSQMLLARLDPQDPHRNAVSVICQESDRLAQIVTGFQQLRELARPQGRQES